MHLIAATVGSFQHIVDGWSPRDCRTAQVRSAGSRVRASVRCQRPHCRDMYRGAMASICSMTSLMASGCLSGGYLYFTSNRLMEDRSLARTSSLTAQSVLTSRRMTATSSRAIWARTSPPCTSDCGLVRSDRVVERHLVLRQWRCELLAPIAF